MFHQNIMEYAGSLSRSYASRIESQYGQVNDSINRLIDDLGLKVQKQLAAAEERALLNYAEDLLQTQNRFQDLKETRRTKSQALDQQIAEYEQRRSEDTVSPLQRTQSSKKLEREHSRAEESATNQCERALHERRLRDKTEQIKEFTSLISDEKTTLQRIFSRHDIASLKSEREKTAVFYQVFGDKQGRMTISYGQKQANDS